MSGIPFRMDPAGTQILPAGYRLCEYLESTGTQYIDTGIIGSNIGEARADIQFNSLSGVQINGCLYNSSSLDIAGISSGVFFMRNGASNAVTKVADKNRHLFIVSQTNKTCYIDSELVSTSYSLISILPYSLYLFGRHVAWTSSSDSRCNQKLYDAKIFDRESKLIQHLIPALAPQDKDENPTPNGTPCMFDIVTQKPFYNAGTGTFQYALASTTPQSN